MLNLPRQKIVRPNNLSKIVSLLKSANKSKTPIFPVSGGKNWGYELSQLKKKGIILDLSKLNKIIDYNEQLAYVTVEPGVTFEKLFNFLKKKKSRLMLTTTGASPKSSLIGATVERGIGRGFYPKRNEYVCGFEIVLPNGKVINTGMKPFGGELLSHVFKEGIGPDFSGLFLQSNLGIVTKMTIWLAPMPDFIRTFSCHIKNESNLPGLIDNLRVLKFKDLIKGNFFFANDYKILASKQQYPWKEMKNKTPLNDKTLNRLKSRWGIKGGFTIEGMIASTDKKDANYKTKTIKTSLKSMVFDLRFSNLFPTKALYFFKYDRHNLPGIPSEEALLSIYWRKKIKVPEDINPWRDKCGIMWIGLVSPLLGEVMTKTIKEIKRVFVKYAFEPNIGFNLATDRAAYIIVAILYDKEVKGEDKRASKCYKETITALKKYGILPYRLTTESMNLIEPDKEYISLLRSLKKLVDPNNILAPGRYDFTS